MLFMRSMWRSALILLCSAILAACGVAPQTAQHSVQPTYTSLPTYTPRPTYTMLPTSTAAPTSTIQPAITATATTTIVAETAAPAASTNAIADMLIALNQRRSEGGCTNLTIDARLQTAAQNHADDLAQRRQVDHRGADGASLEQRLERVGYPFARRSETIAVGHATSPQAIVDIWLDEPPDGPHRSTILNCAYPDVGIGAAQADETITYWVVDYAEPQMPENR